MPKNESGVDVEEAARISGKPIGKREVHMTFLKETPGTYVFREGESDEGMPPVIGTMYVRKWGIGNRTPKGYYGNT